MTRTIVTALAVILATGLYVIHTSQASPDAKLNAAQQATKEAMQSASDHAKNQIIMLRQVEAPLVCMINDHYFGTTQTAVPVGDVTYYGCCAKCADTLKHDPSSRTAIDPVSGNEVDKATAVIGADSEDNAYYFENEENLHMFSPK